MDAATQGMTGAASTYARELETLYGQYENDAEKLKLLKALWQYAQEIV